MLTYGLSDQDLDNKEKEIKNYLQSLLGQTGSDDKLNNDVKILTRSRAQSFYLKENGKE